MDFINVFATAERFGRDAALFHAAFLVCSAISLAFVTAVVDGIAKKQAHLRSLALAIAAIGLTAFLGFVTYDMTREVAVAEADSPDADGGADRPDGGEEPGETQPSSGPSLDGNDGGGNPRGRSEIVAPPPPPPEQVAIPSCPLPSALGWIEVSEQGSSYSLPDAPDIAMPSRLSAGSVINLGSASVSVHPHSGPCLLTTECRWTASARGSVEVVEAYLVSSRGGYSRWQVCVRQR